jgi:N-[(2S)-2-amino-2-carboxyethyl]-L-glutamate dehydrogenase
MGRNGDLLILTNHEVRSLLDGCEKEIIEVVSRAYQAHEEGRSSLPHSTFLRFPDDPRNRIISLPAYLGSDFGVAGLKWIASFPDNLKRGLERASGILILSSTVTGRPQAVLDASVVSAKRTAASAALAAQTLQGQARAELVGIVGCGLISFESVRFLLAACPEIKGLVIQDIDEDRARIFKTRCRGLSAETEVEIVGTTEAVLSSASLVLFATTAITPYVTDLSGSVASTILHISLRDLGPGVLLSCDNIVDDVDHVCRAQTSVHLAEQLVGQREFIRGTLASVLQGVIPPRADDKSITVFSPFGLGILDIAVGKLVMDRATKEGRGTVIETFSAASIAEGF